MKKLYIGLTLCATAMLLPGLSAHAQTDISNETKLGKTINAVEAESYGDISKYSVLSPDYYSKLEYISNYDKAVSETNAIKATSNRSFYSKYNLEESNTYMSLKAIYDSCILPAVSSIENISQAYEYWNNNTNISTGTIVEYDDDSLVPIWDILPDDSPVSSIEMKEKFMEYAEGKEYIITSSSEGHVFNDLTSSYTRSNSKTITDCDRFSNYIDSFSLDTIYGVEVLKKKYDYIKFDISFKAEKKKFGDRYVYLYYGEDAYVGSDMHKYSLASGSISCPISGIVYSRSKTFTIKCENLKSKNFALVWRATGYKSDKWYCKNVNVKITAYKK